MRALVTIITACALVGAVVWGSTVREPITIGSEEEFTEENGVTGGRGTSDDPYRISGCEIQVPEGARYGIRIEGTTAAFVIDGCVIKGARNPEGAAIYLDGVENGAVEDTVVQDGRHGLELVTSQGIRVSSTYFFVEGVGLRVLGTSEEHFEHRIEETNAINGKAVHYHYGLEDEVVEGIEGAHVTVAGSRNVLIRGVSVEDGDGLTVAFCEDVTVEDVDLFENRASGLSIVNSPRTSVRDSERIANNADAGITIWLSNRSTVENAGLYANHTGVHISASDRVRAEANIYAGNQVGLRVDGSAREVDIVGGLVFRGHDGIHLESARGPRVQGLAIAEVEIGVLVDSQVTDAIVSRCTVVDAGYGVSVSGSYGMIENNLIARADIGILFPETYGEATPVGNTLRRNLLHRAEEGLYLGRETKDNVIYENVFWDCVAEALDAGRNDWSREGRGNWYSGYEGSEVDDTGVGEEPMKLERGLEDPAPLVDPDFLGEPPGLLGLLEVEGLLVEDADGRTAEVEALLADTADARFIRMQGVPAALAEDLALLSRWDSDVQSRFRSKHIFVPLEVFFFSEDGAFVGKAQMDADSDEAQGVPGSFRMALELRAGLLDTLGLEAPVSVRR